MNTGKTRVCPVEHAGSLDNKIRMWFHNPRKILSPFVKMGMTVLDFGCGPGFFTIEMAKMVGSSGKVIAADLQEGMLQIIRDKIRAKEPEERIELVKADKNNINVTEQADFILAFYVVHEVPDKENLFKQLKALLKENGTLLVVEPRLFHVSKKEFALTLQAAQKKGFCANTGPKLLFSQSALLTNS